MNKIFLTKVLLLSIIFAFLPIVSSAQTINLAQAFSNELDVDITPDYPGPNNLVSVNLNLYTADLDTAQIVWYKNNQKVLDGKGETRYSFKLDGIGEATQIKIDITLNNGVYFTKSINFNPAEVSLIWEADSYVPPFYKGKTLHPKQGNLKVIALPEFINGGKKIDPQNLIYKWSNGLTNYQSQSGYGKNILILNGSVLGKSENIKVVVTDPESGLSAEKFLYIKPVDPQIVFYENNPYYGHIFDQALVQNFEFKGEEVQILAAPFYFTKDSNIKYEWRLNNNLIKELSDARLAIFRKPEGDSGRSNISLQINNPKKILQFAENNLIMNFEN
ncbi:MAG: hypothetical protein JW740_01790 [Candidatus Zambryskibacteria bacterium]|nr:hypothetical protein [Candidatus Zambryskibacteria bacterium]